MVIYRLILLANISGEWRKWKIEREREREREREGGERKERKRKKGIKLHFCFKEGKLHLKFIVVSRFLSFAQRKGVWRAIRGRKRAEERGRYSYYK